MSPQQFINFTDEGEAGNPSTPPVASDSVESTANVSVISEAEPMALVESSLKAVPVKAEAADDTDGDGGGRCVKVGKYQILKPIDGTDWNTLGQLLRDASYLSMRLANMFVCEMYHYHRTKRHNPQQAGEMPKVSVINRRLRDDLKSEGWSEERLARFSKVGALPGVVYGALSQYKLRSAMSASAWTKVLKGQAAPPAFKHGMPIQIRCDNKDSHCRIEREENGDYTLKLMITGQPYVKVVLKTRAAGGGHEAILKRLIENEGQSINGYRQRYFEIKYDERHRQWFLSVVYDFKIEKRKLKKSVIVGVDVGFKCPVYAAISNGHARLGRREFEGLMSQIQAMRWRIKSQRRKLQRMGRVGQSDGLAQSGHGRKRKLQALRRLERLVNDLQTTINHRISRTVIEFCLNHGAGTIQMEDLTGLKDFLDGTFLGEHWRYHQLQTFIENKAKEHGIDVVYVNPRYTSRRCSECGFIHHAFDRSHRDDNAKDSYSARFICPKCGVELDADYNAARNIATVGIEELIKVACKSQGLPTERVEKKERKKPR